MSKEDGIGFCGTCGRKATWVTLDGYGGCEVHGRGPLNWTRPYPDVDVRDGNGVRYAAGQRVVEGGTVVAVRDEEGGPVVEIEYDDLGTVETWLSWQRVEGGPFVMDDAEIEEGS